MLSPWLLLAFLGELGALFFGDSPEEGGVGGPGSPRACGEAGRGTPAVWWQMGPGGDAGASLRAVAPRVTQWGLPRILCLGRCRAASLPAAQLHPLQMIFF